MPAHWFTLDQGVLTLTKNLRAFLIVLLLALTSFTHGSAADHMASKTQPLSLGKDQTIIDLNNVVWEPLTGEGIPPGPEIAILRGSLADGGGEALVRLPANSTFPTHRHTSDELYVWLKGDYTEMAADGTATALSGQTYMSLPGGVPHALPCGKEPCIFYIRYARPFDYHIHSMPARQR